MKKFLLGTAAVMAFASSAVAGDPVFSGTIGADYAQYLNSGTPNGYGFDATAQVLFGDVGIADQLGIEAIGGYHELESANTDFWNLGGAIFAGSKDGRIAGSYLYHEVGSDVFGYFGVSSVHFNTFGAGGEWFVTPKITLAVRGGAVDATGAGGGYAGLQGTYYPLTDLALSAGVDYWSAGVNVTSMRFQVEYLPDPTIPLAPYVSFEHENISGAGADIVFIGFKIYLNGDDSASLVDRQRSATNGYIVQSPLFLER